jgi:hypothetical protein
MSLYGFAWVGFGIDMLLRFAVLSIDSFTFGNNTSRLADASEFELNFSLLIVFTYLVCMVAAYRVGMRFISKVVHFQLHMPAETSRRGQTLLALISAMCVVLSSGYLPVPLALLTVLGIVGSLWVVPATFVWWERFYYGRDASSPLLWMFLVPGFLKAVLSPYRENLLMPVFVILLAMLFAGRKVRFWRVAALMVTLLVLSTAIIGTYREILWQDADVAHATESGTSGFTLDKTYDAKWVETLRRFHAFDSLLLTVRYVPDLLPYSDRNVFVDAILRGIIPRAVYGSKEGSNRGMIFGQTIWAVDSDPFSLSGAAIAPSMPGDLYEAGGFGYVVLGALCWGLVLGLLEGWKERVSPKAAAALTLIFALDCFASIERDYAHMVSTTIQYLIVMFLVSKLLGRGTDSSTVRSLKRKVA